VDESATAQHHNVIMLHFLMLLLLLLLSIFLTGQVSGVISDQTGSKREHLSII